jgi:phage-related protein
MGAFFESIIDFIVGIITGIVDAITGIFGGN